VLKVGFEVLQTVLIIKQTANETMKKDYRNGNERLSRRSADGSGTAICGYFQK